MLVLGARPVIKGETLELLLGNVERHVISSVLRHHKGNKSRAAVTLGISRQGLYYKIGANTRRAKKA
jgi:transcriptional regulator with PAS, ATPase and Fis domain